jgi:hypothetical protein
MSTRGKIWVHPFVLAIYAGVAVLTTWPLLTQITTHLPGNSTDHLLHYWNGWWVREALSTGQSPLFTPYLFYPQGISLITHNIAWFQVMPWLALEPLLGGILAYNVVLLVHLALCGYCAFLAISRLTGDARAAFVAGLIYQAWPFRLSQLDHPNLLATEWFPLFFLYLVLTIRRGRWRDGVLTGLFFALVGYTRWQQLIPLTLMALVYFACTAPRWLSRDGRHVLARLTLAAAIAIAALLPPLWLLVSETGEEEGEVDLIYEHDEVKMQTDALAYLTPSAQHPLFGEWTGPLYGRYYSERSYHRRYSAYIGLVAAILAALGLYYRRWKSLPWVLMAVLLVLLAQGLEWRFNGELYSKVPTLYRLSSPLVFIRWIRVPDRFNMFLSLPVSVLAAYGLAGLLGARPALGVARGLLLSGLLSAMIVFEYLITPVPVYHHEPADAPFYEQIAQEQGDFAVLDIPFNKFEVKGYMFEQTVHRRPIMLGAISRRPKSAFAYLDSVPLLYALGETDEMPYALRDVSRQLSTLGQDGIRYIIAHKTWAGEDRIAHWRRYLALEPRYEDAYLAIYATAPEPGRDYVLSAEPLPGLGPIQVILSSDCLNPGRALEAVIAWGSTGVPGRDLDVVLALADGTGANRYSERFPLSASWPTSEWPENTIARESYRLPVPGSAPAGLYDLALALHDPESGQRQGEVVSLGPLTVQQEICNLATRPEARDANALFGDRMRLVEYSAVQERGRLFLDLYWRSEGWMDTDFKIFVHVADPVTGIPSAQSDIMPHYGAYPTTWWWPGEGVHERISLPLDPLPAGSYDIVVGVYEPTTGERLSLVNSQGDAIADSRFMLEEKVEIK